MSDFGVKCGLASYLRKILAFCGLWKIKLMIDEEDQMNLLQVSRKYGTCFHFCVILTGAHNVPINTTTTSSLKIT